MKTNRPIHSDQSFETQGMCLPDYRHASRIARKSCVTRSNPSQPEDIVCPIDETSHDAAKASGALLRKK
jgi:hypothetical protein